MRPDLLMERVLLRHETIKQEHAKENRLEKLRPMRAQLGTFSRTGTDLVNSDKLSARSLLLVLPLSPNRASDVCLLVKNGKSRLGHTQELLFRA